MRVRRAQDAPGVPARKRPFGRKGRVLPHEGDKGGGMRNAAIRIGLKNIKANIRWLRFTGPCMPAAAANVYR
jgi:hypothetical protein